MYLEIRTFASFIVTPCMQATIRGIVASLGLGSFGQDGKGKGCSVKTILFSERRWEDSWDQSRQKGLPKVKRRWSYKSVGLLTLSQKLVAMWLLFPESWQTSLGPTWTAYVVRVRVSFSHELSLLQFVRPSGYPCALCLETVHQPSLSS